MNDIFFFFTRWIICFLISQSIRTNHFLLSGLFIFFFLYFYYLIYFTIKNIFFFFNVFDFNSWKYDLSVSVFLDTKLLLHVNRHDHYLIRYIRHCIIFLLTMYKKSIFFLTKFFIFYKTNTSKILNFVIIWVIETLKYLNYSSQFVQVKWVLWIKYHSICFIILFDIVFFFKNKQYF